MQGLYGVPVPLPGTALHTALKAKAELRQAMAQDLQAEIDQAKKVVGSWLRTSQPLVCGPAVFATSAKQGRNSCVCLCAQMCLAELRIPYKYIRQRVSRLVCRAHVSSGTVPVHQWDLLSL